VKRENIIQEEIGAEAEAEIDMQVDILVVQELEIEVILEGEDIDQGIFKINFILK